MSRKVFVILAVMTLVLVTVIPVTAITYGEPDEDGHPYVGLVVFDDAEGPAWRCSGTLLSPTVFLTAGHCTDGAVAARIWFESEVTDPAYPFGGGTSVEAAEIHTHPGWDWFATFPNTSDLGIVILEEEVNLDEYGALLEIGVLDELATRRGLQDIIVRTVGYGLQEVRPFLRIELVRYTATSMIVNLRSALTDGYNLHTSNNPGQGQGTGGSCFGDSGGPIFYPEDSNMVVAVVSFGLNANCKGADFGYRTDIENARAFILPFLEE